MRRVDVDLARALEFQKCFGDFKVNFGLSEALRLDVGEFQMHLFENSFEELLLGFAVIGQLEGYAGHELPVVHKHGLVHGLPEVSLHLRKLEGCSRPQLLGTALELASLHHCLHHLHVLGARLSGNLR